jgi:hypothetical protein
MSTHTRTIQAVIDLGSNSAKITIARTVDDIIESVENESTMIRLGESVNASGQITPEKQDTVITTLRQYQQLAQKYEASSIIVVATEAVRKAQNCEAFLNAVQQETGLTVHLVSGEIEAALTFLGATSDQQGIADTGVIDIGGGSTELIIAQEEHIQWLISLPIGSGWLHDHYLSSDPPAHVEVENARILLSRYVRQLDPPHVPAMLIATGSSAKYLLALAKQALKVDKECHTLSRNDLLGCFELLSTLPAAEISQRYEQPLERARVLPSGALILLTLMDFLQREEISVSQRGVSEGALLATLRYGDSWIDDPDITVGAARIARGPDISDLDESDKPATDKEQESSAPDLPSDQEQESSTLDLPSSDQEQESSTLDLPSDQEQESSILDLPSSDQEQESSALDLPSSDQEQEDSALDLHTFAETGRRELRKHSQRFVKWIDPVLQNEDVEAVHKMRVASRYLRATLDAYQSACARKPFQRVYREVKQAADLLGTARDTDVMLQHLEQQQIPENEMPGLQWLVSRLQSYRKQQQREIATFFENFRSKRFQRSVASCIREGASHRGKS